MATVKVKLRPSSVKDKAGTIYYRIIHTRRTQHITTILHVFPEEWDAENGTLLPSARNRTMIQNRIDSDIVLSHLH